MDTLILPTKLFAPPLHPGWILRKRLIEQLNISSQHKLTLVSAPAGYGKTTLISSCMKYAEDATRIAVSLIAEINESNIT